MFIMLSIFTPYLCLSNCLWTKLCITRYIFTINWTIGGNLLSTFMFFLCCGTKVFIHHNQYDASIQFAASQIQTSYRINIHTVSTVKYNFYLSQSISSPGEPGFGLSGNWPVGQAGTVNEKLKLMQQPILRSLPTISKSDRRICFYTAFIRQNMLISKHRKWHAFDKNTTMY